MQIEKEVLSSYNGASKYHVHHNLLKVSRHTFELCLGDSPDKLNTQTLLLREKAIKEAIGSTKHNLQRLQDELNNTMELLK